MKNIREFIVVAFAVLIVQVSSQSRILNCFECSDCNQIDTTSSFQRDCYGPDTTPTRVTNPSTISLTEVTTAVPGQIVATTPNITTAQQPSEIIETFSTQALFSCFAIRSRIGDRSIVSRGCALIHSSNEETCRSVNQGENPEFCQLCDEDTCNSQNVSGVGKLFSSMALIFAFFFITMRLV